MDIHFEGNKVCKLWELTVSDLVQFTKEQRFDVYIADGDLHIEERGSYEEES